MRDTNRIEDILSRIEVAWKNYPDLRLGQLILNVLQNPVLYYVEDEQLAELIEQVYGKPEIKEHVS